jgi:predicted GIY-YIG superfamily endonuclease
MAWEDLHWADPTTLETLGMLIEQAPTAAMLVVASGAIAREKQIKAGSRQKKIDLINGSNPEWRDLYDDL